MARVAMVTCAAYPALFEDDHGLVAALGARGVDAVPVVWSDPDARWDGWDAIVLRSPWDYFERLAEFQAWLDARIAAGAPLINDARVLTWNLDKGYLAELAAAGVAQVPTVVVARGEELPDLAALAAARGWAELVVKPTISAGAYRTYRFAARDAADHRDAIAATLADRGVLIQPFLPAIGDGEISMVFIAGAYSHAVRKLPAAGDYRVQFMYGGTCAPTDADPAWIAAGRACLAAAPALPTYARVDGVIVDGQFVLMELEAIEPVLYLGWADGAADRLAQAITARL